MSDEADKDKVIDFDKRKSPFLEKKKEDRLKDMKSAFKKALNLNEGKKKSKKKKSKKKRK